MLEKAHQVISHSIRAPQLLYHVERAIDVKRTRHNFHFQRKAYWPKYHSKYRMKRINKKGESEREWRMRNLNRIGPIFSLYMHWKVFLNPPVFNSDFQRANVMQMKIFFILCMYRNSSSSSKPSKHRRRERLRPFSVFLAIVDCFSHFTSVFLLLLCLSSISSFCIMQFFSACCTLTMLFLLLVCCWCCCCFWY